MKPQKGQLERRHLAGEMRTGSGGKIAGYAAVFNLASEDLGGFREIIRPGAFTRTLRSADVRALWNHDPNFVLGRKSAGTLALQEDEHGLFFEVQPPDASWARDLGVSIRRGDVNQASFEFRAVRDKWGADPGGRGQLREVFDVELYDVGPVTYPAYPQTAVDTRSLGAQLAARLRASPDPELIAQFKWLAIWDPWVPNRQTRDRQAIQRRRRELERELGPDALIWPRTVTARARRPRLANAHRRLEIMRLKGKG